MRKQRDRSGLHDTSSKPMTISHERDPMENENNNKTYGEKAMKNRKRKTIHCEKQEIE